MRINSIPFLNTVWVPNFVVLKFCVLAETSLLLSFQRFYFSWICYGCNYHALFCISCAMLLVDQENNSWSFSWVVNAWLDESTCNKGVPFSSLSCPAMVGMA